MSVRRTFLDAGFGESRGVVTLDGRPERLMIMRDAEPQVQRLGARVRARVRTLERSAGIAFLELGRGPDAVLNLSAETGRLVEGAAVEVEIRAEGRRGKGPTVRWLGAGEGGPGLLEPAPTLDARLRSLAPEAEPVTGSLARETADQAQEEALETVFGLPGGGALAVEPTRALTAVDVDLGARRAASPKQAARAANLAALAVAARVLRLKGLGGLVVIDLVGSGHDGPALLAAARAAFAPDNPGVAFGAISRFGALELSIPRRLRPTLEHLLDEGGVPAPAAVAFALVRALEREAAADGGGRFAGVASPRVARAAGPALAALKARVGDRLALRVDPAKADGETEVTRW